MSGRRGAFLRCLLLYVICWLLQVFLRTLVPGLPVVPDISLMVTAGLMFLAEETVEREKWMIAGLTCAFVWDLVFGFYVGISFIATLAVCLLILAFLHNVQAEGLVLYLFFLAAVTFVYVSVGWLLGLAGGAPYGYLYALRTLPVRLILNLLTGLVVYWVMAREDFRMRRKNWYR